MNLLLGNSKSRCCKHGEASMCTLLSIYLHIYSEVNWLIIILANLWGTSTLFSLVIAPFYTPTKNATAFLFLRIFSDTMFSFPSFLPPSISSGLPSLPPFFKKYNPSSQVGKTQETLTWDLKPSMKALGGGGRGEENYMCYISPVHSATIVTEGKGNTPDLASPVSPVKNLPYSTVCKFQGKLGSWCPPNKSRSLCCLVLAYAVLPCDPLCKASFMSKFYIFFKIYIYLGCAGSSLQHMGFSLVHKLYIYSWVPL